MRSSMAILKKHARTAADGFIAVGIGVGFCSLPLVILLWLFVGGACITETREKFSNISGFNFEVIETDCDLIAKDASISVLVSRGARTRQTLLFKYDPGGAPVPLPVIRLVGANSVRISVPRVSSLFYRTDHWETLSIDYDIGAIEFPANQSSSK
jgi:hypothetical protein